MEASTNQVADQQMPVYNLLPKILCRVVNVQLKVCEICLLVRVGFLGFCESGGLLMRLICELSQAEPDTDEVFAQVTLLPLHSVSIHC